MQGDALLPCVLDASLPLLQLGQYLLFTQKMVKVQSSSRVTYPNVKAGQSSRAAPIHQTSRSNHKQGCFGEALGERQLVLLGELSAVMPEKVLPLVPPSVAWVVVSDDDISNRRRRSRTTRQRRHTTALWLLALKDVATQSSSRADNRDYLSLAK